MYTVWVKVDETLPWIELEGTYQTRKEAREAAEKFLSSIKIRVPKISQKRRT